MHLLAAGFRNDALAALAVRLPPPDSMEGFVAVKWCVGLCTTPYHNYHQGPYKELWFCEDCWDTRFCEKCLPIVQAGKLPSRKCGPDHSFVQVIPTLESARNVAARFINGVMVPQEEWVEELWE
jgi:hypothetical protein